MVSNVACREDAGDAGLRRVAAQAGLHYQVTIFHLELIDEEERTRALDTLRRRGEVVPDELLAHIAPLGWQHINLTGDYLWAAEPQIGPDGFRPLRTMASALQAA